ncbi:hypothetical protein BDR03DRAFT_942462, partial [Suillus americanus]
MYRSSGELAIPSSTCFFRLDNLTVIFLPLPVFLSTACLIDRLVTSPARVPAFRVQRIGCNGQMVLFFSWSELLFLRSSIIYICTLHAL